MTVGGESGHAPADQAKASTDHQHPLSAIVPVLRRLLPALALLLVSIIAGWRQLRHLEPAAAY